jgi:2-polyprenyl-3-methyl-5-hydroxy-6-metoxy-1,4-benzoquinol methylase
MRLITRAAFVCLLGAIVYLLQYIPKYLYLTTDAEKKYRWYIKIRWPVCAAAFGLGLLNLRTKTDVYVFAAFVAWLALVAATAGKLGKSGVKQHVSVVCFAADIVLLAILGVYGVSLPIIGALAAVTVMLELIPTGGSIQWLNESAILAGLVLLITNIVNRHGGAKDYLYSVGLYLSAVGFFYVQLKVARLRYENNWRNAVQALSSFSGRTVEEVSRLIRTGDDILAEKWKEAGLEQSDKEGLRQWYRNVSFYYLFALSGFHQLYKHIAFSIDVLKMANGKCLDYGAGMGDLALEFARRGHVTTYFDVDGHSKAYAEWHAEQSGIKLKFTTTREQLVDDVVKSGRFKTIVSLDVLEHLPDIENELGFLISLLEPGGKIIFSIPFGSTDAHPMHLDHDLDVLGFLASHGLRDKKSAWLRWISSEPLRDKGVLIYEKNPVTEAGSIAVGEPSGI